jgi:predicted acylesterase/phospholipase RssA
VPGLSEPLELSQLYPEMTVRLVDGGVHDNQGVAGLLEQDANFLIVTDASGQMGIEKEPVRENLFICQASSSAIDAKIRVAMLADCLTA